MHAIRLAETDADVVRCAPVLRELRPHVPEDEVLPRVRRQERDSRRDRCRYAERLHDTR